MRNLKRYFQFLLIILAAGSIFPLIFLRGQYQETILVVFEISIEQLNGIYAALGLAFVLGYFPSGWLADKFSAKKLMFISLLMCGLAGIWFSTIPSYEMVLVIFTIWGIFAVFTFWSAHLKLVKFLAQKGEEGRFYGILDGGRGMVEALLATIALMIFSQRLGVSTDISDKTYALQGVISLYAWVLIFIAILIFVFVKEDEINENVEVVKQPKQGKHALKQVLSNKFVWLLGVIILLSYTMVSTNQFLGGFLQSNVGINAVTVGQVMVAMLWMRPIGGIGGGFLGDRFGKSRILAIALALCACFLIVMSILPTTASANWFKLFIILIGLMIFTIRGLYWSLLGECQVDDLVIGLAIGFISFIGYLPDFFVPLLKNQFLFIFGNEQGQNAYFIFSAIIGLMGILAILAFKIARKKELNQKI